MEASDVPEGCSIHVALDAADGHANKRPRIVGYSATSKSTTFTMPREPMKHVRCVLAFSNAENIQVLFEDPATPPPTVTPMVYILDVSGSMNKSLDELRLVTAAFLKDTNAEGKVVIPTLEGKTAMVHAVLSLKDKLTGADAVIFTDGMENHFHGSLPVGTTASGELDIVDLDVKDHSKSCYLSSVARFLKHICKMQLYYVGLGPDPMRLMDFLTNDRRVHLATVRKNASPAEVYSTVRELKRRGFRADVQTANKVADEDADVHAQPVSITLNDEAVAALGDMDVSAIRSLSDAAGRIVVAGQDVPWTPKALQDAWLEVEQSLADDHKPLFENRLQLSYARATVGFFLWAAQGTSGQGVPTAIISGNPKKGKCVICPCTYPSIKNFYNQILNRFADRKMVVNEKHTSAEGDDLTIALPDGATFRAKFPKCQKYSASIPTDVLVATLALDHFGDPIDKLERLRKVSPTSSPVAPAPAAADPEAAAPAPAD